MTKLSGSGAALDYSTYLGGVSFDEGNGIAVDGAGTAYVAGFTYSPDFPTTAGAFDTTYNDAGDAFVTSSTRAAPPSITRHTWAGASARASKHRRRRRRHRLS